MDKGRICTEWAYKSTQVISIIYFDTSHGFRSHSKVMPKSSMTWSLIVYFSPDPSHSFLIFPSTFLHGHLWIYSYLYLKCSSLDIPKAHTFPSFMSFFKCISVKLFLTTLIEMSSPLSNTSFFSPSYIYLTFDIFYFLFLLIILCCEVKYFCPFYSLVYLQSVEYCLSKIFVEQTRTYYTYKK